MKVTNTLWQWYEIYNLPPDTKFTDSKGDEFWAVGEGHVHNADNYPVRYETIELPVTTERYIPARLQVKKLRDLEKWIVVGHAIYESFLTHRDAIFWAQKRVRE